MALLHFRYGAVGSAKTLNLLAVAHQYERQGKRVLVLKPAMDDRFGNPDVVSRAGLSRPADQLFAPDAPLDGGGFVGISAALVDEAQFLSAAHVDQLRAFTVDPGVLVICYGLRTDFRSRLFEGSRRLLEVADSIDEVRTTCAFCESKAVLNLKSRAGRAVLEGPSVELGAEELYQPVCFVHYRERLRAAAHADPLSDLTDVFPAR